MSDAKTQPVTVTNIDIHFGTMVLLLIKLAFASIPALIVVWGVMFVASLAFIAFFGGMGALATALGG